MLNYRKIAKVLLVAAFFCTFISAMSQNAMAQYAQWQNKDGTPVVQDAKKKVNPTPAATTKAKTTPVAKISKLVTMKGAFNKEYTYYKNSRGKWMRRVGEGKKDQEVTSTSDINKLDKKLSDLKTPAEIAAEKAKTEAGAQKFEENWRKTTGKQSVVPEFHSCPEGKLWVDRDKKCVDKKELVNNRCSMPEYKDTEACKIATGKKEEPKAAGSNDPQTDAKITGCSKNRGLFSGLITTGEKIFKGLRDLIYVVAGFGIIGVAVGGFFGNLNWKWLGAIIIGLVVIATTGELINAITGCPNYTSGMIADTLK